jgi:hypothetical protein
MRAKGYGISRPVFRAASESFRAKDMATDADLHQESFAGHARIAAAAKVCKILRAQDKLDSAKLTMLSESGVEVSDGLVASVVEKVARFSHRRPRLSSGGCSNLPRQGSIGVGARFIMPWQGF